MTIVDGENNTFSFTSIDIYAILALIEFCIHFCLLPISLLNVSVIGTSSLVHPSLKCLLLAQSALIAMGSGQRIFELALILSASGTTAFPSFPMDHLREFFIISINLLGYSLLLERIVAVRAFANGNGRETKCRNLCLSLLAILFCLCFSMGFAFFRPALFSLLPLLVPDELAAIWAASNANLLFSAIAILAFLQISWFNAQQYGHHRRFTLSQGYLLRENIRALRQLLPCFLFHFLTALCLALWQNALHFDWISSAGLVNFQLWSFFMLILLAAFNISIQITLITFHPKLNASARSFVSHHFCCFAARRPTMVEPAGTKNWANANANFKVPASEYHQNETAHQQHFRILQTMWEGTIRRA